MPVCPSGFFSFAIMDIFVLVYSEVAKLRNVLKELNIEQKLWSFVFLYEKSLDILSSSGFNIHNTHTYILLDIEHTKTKTKTFNKCYMFVFKKIFRPISI